MAVEGAVAGVKMVDITTIATTDTIKIVGITIIMDSTGAIGTIMDAEMDVAMVVADTKNMRITNTYA